MSIEQTVILITTQRRHMYFSEKGMFLLPRLILQFMYITSYEDTSVQPQQKSLPRGIN